jgi:Rieske Fe-S protein
VRRFYEGKDTFVERREFIIDGLRCSAVAGMAVLFPGCARKLAIDINTPANASLGSVGGAVFVADPDDSTRAIIVCRTGTDAVSAFSSKCTHAGGQVALPGKDGICVCQAHGSRFDMTGKVLAKPATQNLKKFVAAVSGSRVSITL